MILAREFLKETAIGEKQVKYIVEQARRGRVQGHRAELFAVRAVLRPAPSLLCGVKAALITVCMFRAARWHITCRAMVGRIQCACIRYISAPM